MKLQELNERYREGGCMYCKKDATTGFVWADGRGIINVCDDHKTKAKNQIEITNKDKVSAVRKLN